MTLLELAHKLRPYIEKAALFLDDKDAIEAVQLFPKWDPEHESYAVGDRVTYNEVLYKCLQAHVPHEGWNPVAATSLWAEVLIPDENQIYEWKQPDSTNAYQIGDKVSFEGHIYESTINDNIWSPSAYPAGWRLIE